MKKLFPLLFIFLTVVVFFRPLLLKGLLPIPSDTIIGLYHPFRDLYASTNPNGVPFKNFLITDPVRQEYPWRFLSISLEKMGQLPLWNPYNASGTPLLANDQSAAFYPLNVLFFLLPFSVAWSLIIVLEVLLSAVFLYWYLRELKLTHLPSLFGGLVFAFSGFSVAWLEWNTVIQTLLWLPFMLLAIEKLFSSLKTKQKVVWTLLLLFAALSSFFAGHLQTFFYVSCFAALYFLGKLLLVKEKGRMLLSALIVAIGFLLLASFQLVPLFQFITLSARSVDVTSWTTPGWFIPYQHLVQFISPDFFGNPTTLNYFGVWNYAELVGYIGIFPLVMVFLAVINAKRKLIWFYISAGIVALLFALPTPIGILPFSLHLPFLSTSQPTRLLSIIDFSLAVLAAFGLDMLLKKNSRKVWIALGIVGALFLGVWGIILLGKHFFTPENLQVAKRNTLIPTLFLIASLIGIGIFSFSKKKVQTVVIMCLILLSVVDLLRFADKFTPFTPKAYLFPSTKSLGFLQKHTGNNRIMTTDSRILPPNFSIMYHLPSVDIYDPLYLRRYGEFIAAMERNKPDISTPFGFNRIITPHNSASPLINLLGVKYILSLSPLSEKSLQKVFEEGQTIVYENKNALPKAFFIKKTYSAKSKQVAITTLFAKENELGTVAVVEGASHSSSYTKGEVFVKKYSANDIVIQTTNSGEGFLVLTDVYYPTWKVYIDGKPTQILLTDYTFRGVEVPKGTHIVEFRDSLF